nr:PsiF family protein [Chitinolyticbacter albus]
MSALLLATGLMCAQSVHAATAQQEKMGSCNKEASAKSLKGDERKAFMSTCLKADAKPTKQQDKMGYCNKEAGAKKLKGDERKAFMSDCLKKK